MKRAALSLLTLTLILGISSIGGAHHPPRMDRCISVELTGRIERIQWQRPHVLVFIRTEDGTVHETSWLAINQLQLNGIYDDTLKVGDEVLVVAGIQRDEVIERPMLLSYIHRPSDDWGWSQRPQGC